MYHPQATINPVLEDIFLLFISFSLVTQFAYTCHHLYYLFVWLEEWAFDRMRTKADRIARALLSMSEAAPKLIHQIQSVTFESLKLYLLVMALLSVTQIWKVTSLFIFVVVFLLFLMIQYWGRRRDDFIANKIYEESFNSEEVTAIDKVPRHLVMIMNCSHLVVWCLSLLCMLNFSYILWFV